MHKKSRKRFVSCFFYDHLCIYAALLQFNHSNKLITMGRGDKKTAKGKRFKGSFGKSRPAKVAVKKAAKKAERK